MRPTPQIRTPLLETAICNASEASTLLGTKPDAFTEDNEPVALYLISLGFTPLRSGNVILPFKTARPSANVTGKPALSITSNLGWFSNDKAAVTVLSVFNWTSPTTLPFKETSGITKADPATSIWPPCGANTCPSSIATTKRFDNIVAWPLAPVTGGIVFMN